MASGRSTDKHSSRGKGRTVVRANQGTRCRSWWLAAVVVATMAALPTVIASPVALAAPTAPGGSFAAPASFGPMTSVLADEVTSWGRNDVGELGNGTLEESDAPGPVADLAEVSAIAAGQEHSLALLSDGSVMTWGSNFPGALGDGATSGPETCERFAGGMGPCSKTPIPVEGLEEVTAISAGGADSLALLASGRVMAWGSDENGQLGDGPTKDPHVPVEVADLGEVVAISAGQEHSLALLKNGTVVAWGRNNAGQLGDGTTMGPEACGEEGEGGPCSKVPVPVTELSEVVAISAGAEQSLALLKNGTVMAWGGGDLGDGTSAGSDVPVPVSNLSEVVAISAGEQSNLALLKDGTVMAWGSNYFGLLGDGSTQSSDVPVEVSNLSEVTAISVGSSSALALESNGKTMAWGSDEYGQLGDGVSGHENSSEVPVAVSGLVDADAIAAGGQHDLALGGTVSIPRVGVVEPNTGPTTGGETVTIDGSDLAGATAVKFGSTEAASFEVQSEDEVTAIAPPGTGIVDVTVTTPEGTSPTHLADEFSYGGPPTIAEVEPNHSECGGREGTRVTIRGANFNNVTAVMFGSQPAVEVVVRDEEVITAWAPAASGTVPITVTTRFGTSALTTADLFTYTSAAMVIEVEPDHGPEAGGTQVLVKGTGLSAEPIEGIAFGGGEFSYTFQMLSEDELSTVSPPGSGTVPVSTFGRCSSATSAFFTYESDRPPPDSKAKTGGGAGTASVVDLLKSALASLSPHLTPTIAGLLREEGLPAVVTAPAAGTVYIDWRSVPPVGRDHAAQGAWRSPSRQVLVASGRHRFSAAGTARIEVELTAAGRRLLRRVKQLKLTATAMYTSSAGRSISTTKAFRLSRRRRLR